jgi:DNA topoisomerase-1
VQYFPDIVDVNFTAQMEDDLDKVATGEMQWTTAIGTFYEPFKQLVVTAQAEIPITKSGPEPIGRTCPEDGGQLVIRYGRYGKFISCSNFPACRYTEPWLEKIGVQCPQDGGDLVMRKTRKGRTFYGCANYPACDFTSWKRPLARPCPNCGGLLVVASKQLAECIRCQQTSPLEEASPEAARE